MAEDKIKWHEIIQDILDNYLDLMSGKKIKSNKNREFRKYIQVDYYCEVESDAPAKKNLGKMVRPFDHLKEVNIIEYKSIHQVLNEKMFRNYVGRALIVETSEPDENRHGKVTLTILTSKRPDSVLSLYSATAINEWKYKIELVKDLDIYILIQKEMRGKKEGDALAFLQALEGEKDKQFECWSELLAQDLENTEAIKKIIQNINKETLMNFVKDIEEKARKKERVELAKKMLQEKLDINLIAKFTELSLEEIQKIQDEISSKKKEKK